MDGSKTINDRKKSFKIVTKLFSIVTGQKRFLEGLENKFVNSDKLVVFSIGKKKQYFNIKK